MNTMSRVLSVGTCAIETISAKSRITGAVVTADGIYAGGIILTLIRT